jgi:hypothetical protein
MKLVLQTTRSRRQQLRSCLEIMFGAEKISVAQISRKPGQHLVQVTTLVIAASILVRYAAKPEVFDKGLHVRDALREHTGRTVHSFGLPRPQFIHKAGNQRNEIVLLVLGRRSADIDKGSRYTHPAESSVNPSRSGS